MAKIAFTGGGTMGHVIPALALVPELTGRGHDMVFIGSKNENEKKVVEEAGIAFYSIKAGKLRRYFDLKNFTDFFNIFSGFFQALNILRRERPGVVFSKGGFISTPVVYAAFFLGIPVILHESDISPGLANRLSAPFAKVICYSFDETASYLSKKKSILTGIPIRAELLQGDRQKGMDLCGFTQAKPVLLVMGGSQGSRIINEALYKVLYIVLKEFQVCHICGRDDVNVQYEGLSGYKAFSYVNEDMKDIFAVADIILARGGATSLFEYLALRKPNVLIPISAKKSRGDQIKNAREFEKKGFSRVIQEEELSGDLLISNIREAYKNRENIIECMSRDKMPDSNKILIGIIEKILKLGVE